MAAVAGAVIALWCNEMPSADLLAHDSLSNHHLRRNYPLLGDARFRGDVLLAHCDVLIFADGSPVFDDVAVPHDDVPGASVRTSHVARAVSSGFS